MLNRIYAYKFLKNCSFWMPIYVLFLQERGLSFSQIGILFSVQSICQALAEYPTGVGADLWSRKNALVASGILKIAYISIVILAHQFPLFVLAYVFYGFSLACENGADSAYVYEYLDKHHAADEFLKVEGRSYFFHLISRSAAGILGSMMASAGLVIPVIASLFAFVVALILSLRFEPDHRPEGRADLRNLVVQHSLKLATKISGSPQLRSMITFYAAQSAAVALAFIYFQPLLSRSGANMKWFGVIYSLWLGCSAFSSLRVARIFRGMSERSVTSGLLVLVIAPLFLLMFRGIGLTIFAVSVIQCAFGLIRPILYSRINSLCADGERTSMLSVAGLIQCSIVALASPLLGRLADTFGLNHVLIALALMSLAGGWPLLVNDYKSQTRGLVVPASAGAL